MEEVLKLMHTPYVGDFLPFFAWIDIGGHQKKMIALMKRVDVFFDEVIENRRRIGNSESGIMVDKLLALQEQEPELYTDQIIRGFIMKKMIALMKRVDVFFDEVIENRRRIGNSESGIMVDKLLALQEQEPELYTDQIIRGFIMIMLIAGTETPYLTLEWAMSLLLNHPNVMKKIKNEIDTHVGTHRLLQEDDLEKLSYLQNVINESLRLCPTLPMLLPREASQDTKIGGYFVPSGTMLLVNAWAIQRDPVLWDKPDEFIPERFEGRSDDKYKMLGFSVGRRGCPGTSLGYRVLGLALGTLIQAFEWEKIGDEQVDMNAFYGLSMAKLTPLQALCKPRPNMIPLFG
ncbi:cytochrome P450 [Artemisia annua]|uniref:Cytochrome P450 n=1 Tax=Artemisia annua TaxID=35608 RepID=A0A2U1LQ76_ARTAN|nr:cytochrome P450 [Artemisia annua]